MKLLLLNPPWSYPKKYFKKSDLSVSIPLGLMYIASAVEKKTDAKVKILDSFTITKNILVEKDGTYHLGARFSRLKKRIEKYDPDVIGITSPFTSQIGNALKVLKICKKLYPKKIVVMGGPHATVRYNELLDKGADVCVIGEAEATFPELIKRIYEGKDYSDVPGTAIKGKVNKGGFIKDLDTICFPAYNKVDLERYFELFKKGYNNRPYNVSERTLPIVTSRGCPYNCVFCSIHLHMGQKWRPHSSAYVVRHLKFLVKKYDVRHFSFEDDNLTLDVKRFNRILDGILHKELNITWDTPNGVRADHLTRELLEKSKQTGCKALVIGVESGQKRVLDEIINKSLDLKKVEEVSLMCKEIGLMLSAFFMIGLPGETKMDIQKTLSFALKLNKKYDVLPSVTFAAPLIGTRLCAIAKENGYLTKELTPFNILVASHTTGEGMIKTDEFTPEYLRGEIDKFYSRLLKQQLKKPVFVLKYFLRNPKMFMSLGVRLIGKKLKRK